MTRFSALARLALAMGMAFGAAAAACADEMAPVPTLSLEELRERHALPQSRFTDLDGIDLHYVDEGDGPVVVLLHASYHSLRTWDLLAERLRDRYRVVRFDFPNAGMSEDNRPAAGEAVDMMARFTGTIDQLMDRLGIERFALVATSSGGTAGFRYASEHPERIERLVLINSAGMPRTARTDPLRERASVSKWRGMKIRPREFWEQSLAENFIAPHTAPGWLIDQAFDFSRLEERAEKAARYRYASGDPKAVLSGIVAPTLILWGKENPTVMHLEADVFEHWLTGAPTAIRKYEGLGHYPYIEDLDAIYPDIAAFLAGDMDGALRRTARVKAGVRCDCEGN